MTWRLLPDDGERDPRTNLAREEALARIVASDPGASTPVLRLWRNAACVVVGRFQLPAAEVDVNAARALGVPVLRRFTGGGAVYHDPGNLNVSLVLRPDDPWLLERPEARRLPGLYRLLLDPLATAVRAMGVPARATERDLVAETSGAYPLWQASGASPAGDRKVGGVAAWLGGRALLVHGTLLVDADLDALDRVCAGPGAPGNPRWERTRSRRVAVTSVARELEARGDPVPTAGAVDLAVVAAFEAAGAEGLAGRFMTEPTAWTEPELAAADRLRSDRYEVAAWHESG